MDHGVTWPLLVRSPARGPELQLPKVQPRGPPAAVFTALGKGFMILHRPRARGRMGGLAVQTICRATPFEGKMKSEQSSPGDQGAYQWAAQSLVISSNVRQKPI